MRQGSERLRHSPQLVAVNAVYELPFGPGKTFLNSAVRWEKS